MIFEWYSQAKKQSEVNKNLIFIYSYYKWWEYGVSFSCLRCHDDVHVQFTNKCQFLYSVQLWTGSKILLLSTHQPCVYFCVLSDRRSHACWGFVDFQQTPQEEMKSFIAKTASRGCSEFKIHLNVSSLPLVFLCCLLIVSNTEYSFDLVVCICVNMIISDHVLEQDYLVFLQRHHSVNILSVESLVFSDTIINFCDWVCAFCHMIFKLYFLPISRDVEFH